MIINYTIETRLLCLEIIIGKENEYMISVVMATYNGEKYIRQQLDSILNQTLKADEILICDDVSCDSTFEILKEYEYANDNIVVYQNEKNLGYAQNFWNLIHKALGTYIVFSDQDDIWRPDKLEKIENVLDNNKDIFALNTGFSFIDSEGKGIKNIKLLRHKNAGGLKRIDFVDFVKSPRYLGMAMAIRKDLLNLVTSEDVGWVHAHDWCLNHTAAFNKGMFYYDLILTDYRLHDNNTYGSSVNVEKNKRREKRLSVIEDETSLARILEVEYKRTLFYEFLSKHRQALEKRKKYYRSKQIGHLLLNYLKYRKYLSFRGLLGDIYTY